MNVAIGPALIRALGWRGARPRVVIVGAGFAGLAAARALAKAPVEVTVIDRRNYHLFQPLLYQVATAGLSPADIATPIRSILRDQANTQVLLGRVDGSTRRCGWSKSKDVA
jgi:NADH:ubiquinone reductase (H+-translocating)